MTFFPDAGAAARFPNLQSMLRWARGGMREATVLLVLFGVSTLAYVADLLVCGGHGGGRGGTLATREVPHRPSEPDATAAATASRTPGRTRTRSWWVLRPGSATPPAGGWAMKGPLEAVNNIYRDNSAPPRVAALRRGRGSSPTKGQLLPRRSTDRSLADVPAVAWHSGWSALADSAVRRPRLAMNSNGQRFRLQPPM